MNDFSHRNPPVAPVTAVTDRVTAIARIAPVEAMTPQADVHRDHASLPRPRPEPTVDAVHEGDDQARTHADYAKVQRSIATILSRLDARPARHGADAAQQAEREMAMLLPQPSIVLPLPPASDAMVAFITQVRESILTQAARTRAAMSNVTAATVDAATV